MELGRAVARQLGVGITISISRDSYKLVPLSEFLRVMGHFNPDSYSDPLQRVEALKGSVLKQVPGGAVGLALLGPPHAARYLVLFMDPNQQLWLVDPSTTTFSVMRWLWIEEEGAWVSF